MKKRFVIVTVFTLALLKPCFSQNAEPWRADQLLSPASLDSIIKSPAKDKPLIICVGPSALIKTSVDAGPAKNEENLARLKQILSAENKDREIVIYCGCCPWSHCPNIKPADDALRAMGFTNVKVLYIADNFGANWVDKGYPTAKGD